MLYKRKIYKDMMIIKIYGTYSGIEEAIYKFYAN